MSISIAGPAARVPLAYELLSASSKHAPKPIQKPPILFLHGFLGSKRENRHVSRPDANHVFPLRLLAKDLRRDVYTLDLRNHGDSGHHPKHNYTEMALDVKSFIETHQLQCPAVIGHSMGAKTAMTLALGSPNLVSEVVAVDNGPIELPLAPEFKVYLESMEKIHSMRVTTHREADIILQESVTSPSVRLWLLSNFIKEKNASHLKLRLSVDILKNALGPLGEFPHATGTGKFSKPVLFLRGLQSHYIPETAFPLMSTIFPRFETVNIDCGHWIVQEKPEQFRQAVVQFLQKHN
ncbi:Alpha/Beta hydrolase protein [Penicillium pulvis]|uniref:Alpha/Beta hydrolase protein n=1 Tax=Penicillium pulvis TaxID=1562058 RepID=UPI002548E35F|nr:Alpha/Beta hydrolase protein [Penicillium pulvis]KAJ5785699.1 Alpha/Beta hydrolase protein [Penicillium pulvis]